MSGETTQRRLVQEDSNGVLLNKIVLSLRNGSSNPALSGFRSAFVFALLLLFLPGLSESRLPCRIPCGALNCATGCSLPGTPYTPAIRGAARRSY